MHRSTIRRRAEMLLRVDGRRPEKTLSSVNRQFANSSEALSRMATTAGCLSLSSVEIA